MSVVILSLLGFALIAGLFTAIVALWRTNQTLNKELVRVVAAAGQVPAAVRSAVAAPKPDKTEDQLKAERDQLVMRKAHWSR